MRQATWRNPSAADAEWDMQVHKIVMKSKQTTTSKPTGPSMRWLLVDCTHKNGQIIVHPQPHSPARLEEMLQ